MLDWHGWLHRWDVQQTRYIPAREERFNVMLDACAAVLPDDFVALDLACGPGAISRRLLARFPRARVIALDYNPILLQLGRQTVDAEPDQLQWLKTNLQAPAWVEPLRMALEQVGQAQVDAVLTTTAMHWLAADVLTRVYEQLGALVREGGVYLDGDHLAYSPHLPAFRRLTQQVKAREQAEAFAQPGSENYAQWWAALVSELRAHAPAYDRLIEEYERNEAARVRGVSEPILALHEAALLNAGFTQISTIWQRWDDRVLLAIKGPPADVISN
jgi:SAM-dependent methyltransferase